LLRPCRTIRSPMRGCLAGWWWEAGDEQAGKRTGDKASGTDRGCGEALCKGFACLRLVASKSSSIELVSRHHRREMPMRWRKNVAPPWEGARLRRLLLLVHSRLSNLALGDRPARLPVWSRRGNASGREALALLPCSHACTAVHGGYPYAIRHPAAAGERACEVGGGRTTLRSHCYLALRCACVGNRTCPPGASIECAYAQQGDNRAH
jgi:hypothetical protein